MVNSIRPGCNGIFNRVAHPRLETACKPESAFYRMCRLYPVLGGTLCAPNEFGSIRLRIGFQPRCVQVECMCAYFRLKAAHAIRFFTECAEFNWHSGAHVSDRLNSVLKYMQAHALGSLKSTPGQMCPVNEAEKNGFLVRSPGFEADAQRASGNGATQ